jgi:acetylornithine deacetylase/succinyl-diaminopimelate desuccinylase-like protein
MRIGFDTAEVILMDEGRCPLVFGEWLGAGENAPTVLVYCHYDVQPADREKDGWDSEPFEPLERDGKIYARGAVDSKSHVIAQLKAIESMLATESKSPVNIKVIFEGEEESGSENINAFIPKNLDRLKADVCVVSDGSMPDQNQPVVDYGLRGIVTMELEVFGPARDLHSGHYGGNVHNPLHALADIIHQLHNPDGSITVPGFYDNVVELDAEEREELNKVLPWIEEEWKIVTGASEPWGEPQYTLLERSGARPTLEINGMAGGFYNDGFKTVLPAKALAKISCRLVPDQQPQRIFELIRDYITEITPPTVQIEMRMLDMGAPAVLLDRKSSSMQAAMNAYEQAWGVRPLLMREGGSIPVMSEFQQHLGIPMVSMPFGFKGCGAHGPNEHVYMDMFQKGIATMIYFYQELTK